MKSCPKCGYCPEIRRCEICDTEMTGTKKQKRCHGCNLKVITEFKEITRNAYKQAVEIAKQKAKENSVPR